MYLLHVSEGLLILVGSPPFIQVADLEVALLSLLQAIVFVLCSCLEREYVQHVVGELFLDSRFVRDVVEGVHQVQVGFDVALHEFEDLLEIIVQLVERDDEENVVETE